MLLDTHSNGAAGTVNGSLMLSWVQWQVGHQVIPFSFRDHLFIAIAILQCSGIRVHLLEHDAWVALILHNPKEPKWQQSSKFDESSEAHSIVFAAHSIEHRSSTQTIYHLGTDKWIPSQE